VKYVELSPDSENNFYGQNQPWATQIGSRATFLLNSYVEGQSTGFFYRFSRFSYKNAIIQRLLKGRIKELKGPQVAHGWSK
jgi:hypothetical protein